MKHAKRLASLLLALTLVLAMAAPAFAVEATGTITITNATEGNTYKVYKVFDATSFYDETNKKTYIAYKLVSGKSTAPQGFSVDESGNVSYSGNGAGDQLTAGDIEEIANYVKDDQPVGQCTAAKDSNDKVVAKVENLPNGYYYITTTTGTAVTITSTMPNASVQDKNEAPELDKKITGVGDGSLDADGKKALAEVGTTVTYTATIKVKKGAVGYVFHDKMDDGLSYNASSLSVQADGEDVAKENYKKTTATGDTITLTFEDDWIKTQIGKTITITYSATVNTDAITVTPLKNTAKVDYGHNGYTNHTLESTTETYEAKFTVTKTDDKKQPLAGAGFVIAKSNTADGTTTTTYYRKDSNDITWVGNIDDATVLRTTEGQANNVVTFTGLADGTYTLIEKEVPSGYNKAADYSFTIAGSDYTAGNLEQSTTVENQAGTVMPSTGGMGTTVLYVVGGILLIGAAVLLITRGRMNAGK